ncbi:MAG: DMT family transporter [Rhodospirillaceae bacterium]
MSAHSANTLKGMACMVAGVILLASQDAITKWLVVDFEVWEIVFYRGIFAFLPLIPLIAMTGGTQQLRLKQPQGVWWRGVVALATTVLVAVAFIDLPLAVASALIFTSPIFLTALSPWLLRERVGWQRWTAVGVGFAGVLVMIQPGTAGYTAWVFFPLAAAFCSASRDILTRRLGVVDSAIAVIFYTNVVALAASALTIPFFGDLPTPTQWGWFVLGGVFATFAHLLIIFALRFAEGSAVSPLKYVSLVWSAILGYVVWGDVPPLHKLLGAALVVGAGLFILYRETALHKARKVA